MSIPMCGTCLDPLVPEDDSGARLSATCCGHVHHAICYNKWSVKHDTCPSCNQWSSHTSRLRIYLDIDPNPHPGVQAAEARESQLLEQLGRLELAKGLAEQKNAVLDMENKSIRKQFEDLLEERKRYAARCLGLLETLSQRMHDEFFLRREKEELEADNAKLRSERGRPSSEGEKVERSDTVDSSSSRRTMQSGWLRKRIGRPAVSPSRRLPRLFVCS